MRVGDAIFCVGVTLVAISLFARACAIDDGAKGGRCFANSTCMPALSCADDGSKHGICVALPAADGGSLR
jgi:hypothetical protein